MPPLVLIQFCSPSLRQSIEWITVESFHSALLEILGKYWKFSLFLYIQNSLFTDEMPPTLLTPISKVRVTAEAFPLRWTRWGWVTVHYNEHREGEPDYFSLQLLMINLGKISFMPSSECIKLCVRWLRWLWNTYPTGHVKKNELKVLPLNSIRLCCTEKASYN